MKYTRCIMSRRTVLLFLIVFTVISIGRPAFTSYAVEGQEEADAADWKMIDHIELKGGWEKEFYDQLVEEASDDGMLIDVSKGKDYYGDGSLALNVMEFSGRESSPEAVEKACIAKLDEETDQIYTVFLAFIWDHPEVFWINWNAISINVSWQWQDTGTGCTYQANIILVLKDDENDMDIRFPEYRTPEAIEEGIKIREEKIAEILEKTEGMSKAEKVVFFDRYLALINAYSTSAWVEVSQRGGEEDYKLYERLPGKAKNCLSALEGSSGQEGPICVGYSKAFQVLCDRSDIPCIYVHGTSLDSDGKKAGHAWNSVCLEGKWYGMDVTGDDMDIEECSAATNDFLLAGSETMIDGMTFNESHTIEEDGINYPILSPCRYEFSPFPYKLEADGQVNGYYNTDDTQDALERMAEETKLPGAITATGKIELKKHVLDTIKGKDITVRFQTGKDGVSWSVNGESVTKGYAPRNQISVKNILFESSSVKNKVYEATKRRNFLHIVSDGVRGKEQGYTAEISIDLKAENAGMYVNRFSYDLEEDNLEFAGSEQIPADGIIHISSEKTIDEIFTISDHPLIEDQDIEGNLKQGSIY